MPERKDLKKYPKEYFLLFLNLTERETVYISAASEKSAASLRRELYNFRVAVREELPCPKFIALADSLTFHLSTNTLRIAKDKDFFANLIQETLNET